MTQDRCESVSNEQLFQKNKNKITCKIRTKCRSFVACKTVKSVLSTQLFVNRPDFWRNQFSVLQICMVARLMSIDWYLASCGRVNFQNARIWIVQLCMLLFYVNEIQTSDFSGANRTKFFRPSVVIKVASNWLKSASNINRKKHQDLGLLKLVRAYKLL